MIILLGGLGHKIGNCPKMIRDTANQPGATGREDRLDFTGGGDW